jgi:hypothetical protein
MEPHHCRAHHIRWWRHGGRTDIDDMCLVCDVHHAQIHSGRWVVTQTDTGHDWTHTATGRTEHRPHAKHWDTSASPPT